LASGAGALATRKTRAGQKALAKLAADQGDTGRSEPMHRQIDDRDVEGVEEVQQCLLHDIVDRSATKTARSGDVDDDRDAALENSR
jgi:hypothetical protein